MNLGHMTRGDHDMDGERMLRSANTVLKIPVAKEVRVAVGIIAPGGGRITGEPVMVTAQDTVGPAVAGGAPVGTGARGQCSPVTAEDQGLEIVQEAPLDRGEQPAGEQEIWTFAN